MPAAPARTPAWTWLALLALNAAVFLWAHAPALRHPLVANDDVRQQIFWMQPGRDASLVSDDLLADYARHYVPWGVRGVYWAAARFVDPLVFAKILPGLLFTALGLLLFRIGRRLGGPGAGWSVVGVYWLMPFFLDRMAGGLARAFAAPLLALFVAGWLERRPSQVAAALLLQGLFIPYLLPVCAGAALLARAVDGRRGRLGWSWPATRRQAAALALALTAALAWNLSLARSSYGPWAGRRELAQAVFSSDGRYGPGVWPPASLLHEWFAAPWESIAPFREFGPAAGGVGVVLGIAFLLLAARRIPWRSLAPAAPLALALLASSTAAWMVARLFPLRFFLPDRYVIHVVHLAYVLAFGLAVRAACRATGPRLRRAGPALLLAAAVLGAARLHQVGLYDFSADAPVIEAVRKLPPDARIAGPPALMDNVLTFGRRRVLVSFELAHPWLLGYWRQIEPRLRDLFDAYYSGNPAAVRSFCARHGVDWLVVDERDFPARAGGTPAGPESPRAPDFLRGRPFFAPFDAQIESLLATQTHFAVLSAEQFPYVRLDEHRRLIDMRPNQEDIIP